MTAFFCHRSQRRFNVVYFFLTCGNSAFTEYIDSYDFKLSKKKTKKKVKIIKKLFRFRISECVFFNTDFLISNMFVMLFKFTINEFYCNINCVN